MNKIGLRIWDRDFDLPIAYQNYPGEEITETQKKTLMLVPYADYDTAKTGVKDYIYKWFSFELGDDSLDNIFRFVMPKSVLLIRSGNTRVFALMCNFRLDEEHGIAVVFENEQFKDAGPKDIIL